MSPEQAEIFFWIVFALLPVVISLGIVLRHVLFLKHYAEVMRPITHPTTPITTTAWRERAEKAVDSAFEGNLRTL